MLVDVNGFCKDYRRFWNGFVLRVLSNYCTALKISAKSLNTKILKAKSPNVGKVLLLF